tara:strand:+ start:4200 stop:4922 length:723 start_codon:yes stop_codon:yes gene_type:complete
MDKVKVLVVEDEIIIADNICNVIEKLGYYALEPAINYTEASELIKSESPDIAILDIQLSGSKTGIDLAKDIQEENKFPFIFLTSNADKDTLNEAKMVMPSAYLIKPFSKEELFTSIEVALYNFSQKEGKLKNEGLIIKDAMFVKEGGAYHKIMFNKISFIKSAHIYVEINLINGENYIVRSSLNELLNKIDNSFIRVHRSYIINVHYLDKIESTTLKINQEIIPISKKYRQELINKINFI